MPTCVVPNEEVLRALKGDVGVGVIQKNLEALCVGMAEYQGVKLTCARAYSSSRAHSYMSALVRLTDFFTLEGPAASRSGISFDPCLVKKPQVYFWVVKNDSQHIHKGLSLFFVLAVRPRSRHFEAKALVMQPSNYRAIPDLLVKLFGQVSVEFLSCPMTLISPIRVLNELNIFGALIRSDLSWTTGPGALYESVNAAPVKPINPPKKVAPSRFIKLGNLIMNLAFRALS